MNWQSFLEQLSHAIAPTSQPTSLDVVSVLAVLGLVVAAFWGHAIAFSDMPAPRFERLAGEQGALLLGKSMMQAGYWLIQPVGRALVRHGVAPGSITTTGLVFASAAGVAIVCGRLGVAGFFLLGSGLCDALDGMVARLGRSSSERGAVFDALVDRLEEILVFVAIAAGGRRAPWMVVLGVAALVTSLVNSYVSAKAEVYRAVIPSGRMRRGERSAWLTTGCLLVPLAQAILPLTHQNLAGLPLMVCTAIVAIGSGISAIGRALALVSCLTPRMVQGTNEGERESQSTVGAVEKADRGRTLKIWLVDSTARSLPIASDGKEGEQPRP